MSKRLNLVLLVGFMSVAVIGGWAATNLFQQTVPIVPGLQGCWRLEGSARQVECLSDEFLRGANAFADEAIGADRDLAVIAYVRRAENLAAQDERLAATCHPSMHKLGQREGRRASGENRVPEFPGGSAQLCTAGYVHGLAEGYLATDANADVAAVFPELCHEPKSREGCAHGVGHALFQARVSDDASSTAKRSIKACEDIPGDVRPSCVNGVYMELAMRTQPAPVPVADFARTCDHASSAENQISCWSYINVSFTTNDLAVEEIPEWCGKAPLPSQYPCIESYGRQVGVRGVSTCDTAAETDSLSRRCIEGAVGLQVGSGHVAPEQASRECRKLDSRVLRQHCANAVGRYEKGRRSVEDSA